MHVLVVDDEPDLRLILRINLERWGHRVTLAADAAEADAAIAAEPPDALLLDNSMPGESGEELLERLQAAGRTPPQVAVLSAMVGEPQADVPGLRFLPKPFAVDELRGVVDAMAAAVHDGPPPGDPA